MTPLDIERATIATWPAAVTEEHDGWFYLACGGVTGRVNAVWPLQWRGGDLDVAIDHVEAWYARRKLPPRFKLTDGAVAPPHLAERLAQRGYECVTPTLIMTCALSQAPRPYDSLALSSQLPPLFDQALRDSTTDLEELEERRSIARRLPSPSVFAVRERDGRPLAIGASATAGALAGVFLMRTVPDVRRQGHALHILRALTHWAAAQGASHAFLQVDAGNRPAIALYEREGFSALTTYRFWRKR